MKESNPLVGSSRTRTLGSVTSTHPIDNLRFSPPEIPFLPAPPTITSAASAKPSSVIVCSTIWSRVSAGTERGSRSAAENDKVSRTVRKGRRKSSCRTYPITFFALNECRDCFVGRSAGEEEAEGREEPRGEYAMEPVVKSRFPARSAMALSSVAVDRFEVSYGAQRRGVERRNKGPYFCLNLNLRYYDKFDPVQLLSLPTESRYAYMASTSPALTSKFTRLTISF